jgi:acyl transferase domain-containing protein
MSEAKRGQPAWVLPLSARHEPQLREQAGRLAASLAARPGELPALQRASFAQAGTEKYRCVVAGTDAQQLAGRLAAVAAHSDGAGSEITVVPDKPASVVFVYPGIGVAYPGMGAGLARHRPYADAIRRCDEIARGLANSPVASELRAGPADAQADDIASSLPAIIALQMALTALLESWAITPDLVLGHSLGEMTAAYAAGCLSMPDALTIACHGSRLLGLGTGRGAMLAAGRSAAEMATLIEPYPTLAIAAHNGPASTVVSGDRQAIADLSAELSARGIFHRDLGAGYAFHSPRLRDYTAQFAEFAQVLAGLKPMAGRTPLVSTLYGEIVPGERLDAGHWAELTCQPVRFAEAVALAAPRAAVFLEVGPERTLHASLAQCLQDYPDIPVLSCLRAGREDEDSLRRAAAALYLAGVPVRWPDLPSGRATDDGLVVSDGPTRPVARGQSGQPPAAAAPQRRRRELTEHVAQLVAEALDEPADQIPADAGLFELGLDSAAAVRLAARLRQEFGDGTVPVTVAFDHPTVSAIAGYLADRLEGTETGSLPPGGPAPRTGSASEPIAIVGMACRVPGAASVTELGELLRRGVDATAALPVSRWDTALHGGERDTAGMIYTRRGGFLPEVDTFDAAFFGVSPAEAEVMDPQQRLLLEVAWHALEDAHLRPDQLRGARCGVYVGLTVDDYKGLQATDRLQIDAYTGTGNLFCVAAGRLSYILGLRGPCLSVDTGCSSSLVTVHLAVQALRAGECDAALVGGVHLMLAPEALLVLCRAGALSLEGRCRAFDAGADGYARGEGCGMVVLKRLSDAQRAGDRIVAVIRGSAVNHDGASGGLTVPSGPAQQAVMRDALAAAGVGPAEVAYVEAHGSGTPLGDPIEMQALDAVYRLDRQADRPLLVGSIKTNIGHLEAAAGVAGLIKAALAVRDGWIPPHLHLREPNPAIPWRQLRVEVPVAGREWPAAGNGAARLAGVSSFGIAGTNAHVILAEPPERTGAAQAASACSGPAVLLPVSARDPGALQELASRYAQLIRDNPDLPVTDLAAAAATGRGHLTHRLAVVAERPAALAERLDAVAGDGTAPDTSLGTVPARDPAIAFSFCGQGCQYPGMGSSLAATEPVFRDALSYCDQIASDQLGGSLLQVMHGPDPDAIHQTIWTHAALFSLQYALMSLWQSWGVTPAVVLGHSVGEVAAACAAGIMSVQDALRLVVARGRLMQQLPDGGRMVAVMADEGLTAEVTARYPDVAVAAVNGPADTVISGSGTAITAAVADLSSRGVETRKLMVSYAGHSPLVDPVLGELEAAARTVRYQPARLDMVSSVTGSALADAAMDAGYWCRNARQPVRFYDAARSMLSRNSLVIDIGPDPVLAKLAGRQGLIGSHQQWLASLRRGRPERTTMLAAAGAAYTAGVELDWERITGRPGRYISLPSYPFQRRRYWRDTTSGTGRQRGHPLLGQRLRSPAIAGAVFESKLAAPWPAHLADHGIYGKTVASAAYHLCAVIAAATELDGPGCQIDQVTFTQPLVLAGQPVTVQVILGDGPGERAFQVASCGGAPDDEWTVHAAGRVRPAAPVPEDPAPATEAERDRVAGGEPAAGLHDAMGAAGYHLGPSFRWLDRIATVPGEAVAGLRRPSAAVPVNAPHPGLIDSCLRLVLAARPGGLADVDRSSLPVPAGLDRIVWYGRMPAPDAPLWCRARLLPNENAADVLTADLAVHDDDGLPVAELRRFRLRAAPQQVLLREAGPGQLRHQVAWRNVPAPGDLPDPVSAQWGDWVILADGSGAGERLASMLTSAGGHCHLIPAADAVGDGAVDRLRKVLAGVADSGHLGGAIMLSALDGREPAAGATTPHRGGTGERGTPELVAAQQRGLYPAVHLARAATAVPVQRLLLVTHAVQAVLPEDRPWPEHAPVHGLARVVGVEHPELGCTVLDLDDSAPAAVAQAVYAALLAPAAEPQLAMRAGRWYAPRLAPAPAATAGGNAAPVRRDGSYLITGGSGALGRHVAQWLADRGAGQVYVMSRHQPAPSALADLDGPHGRTPRRWIGCDVTDERAVADAVADLAGSGPPLRGVVHAAGALSDGTLAQLTDERLTVPLLPKLAGAWNLHQATRDSGLDFFVLFSSVAAVLGNAGQAAYAAGNAFLDALAAHRRRLGLPAVSIAWGPWQGDGMAGRLSARAQRQLLEAGMSSLLPDEAIGVLDTALAGPALLVAARADWPRLAERMPGRDGLLRELASGTPSADTVRYHPRPAGSADYVPPRTETERTLARIWEELFRIRPIGVADNFYEAGGDSILGVRMVVAAREHGLRLSEADVFVNPTVAQLAAVAVPAATEAGATKRAPAAGSATAKSRPGTDVAQLRAEDFPDAGLEQADLELLAGQLSMTGPGPQDTRAGTDIREHAVPNGGPAQPAQKTGPS